MQTGRFVTPIHTVLSGSGASAKTGARLGGNVVGPCDEGDATGRGQPVKPQFDPFEPTVDIALKDFGGIRSKCPRVPRATRGVGKRVGHGGPGFRPASPAGGRENAVINLGELVTILDLHRQGLSVSAIARQVGVERKTVRTVISLLWDRDICGAILHLL